MTDSHTTPEAAILVAVDIAKDHNEVLIELRERRNHRRRFRVANTLEEYLRLVEYLRRLDAPVLIGFEATGNYHRPLAYFLHEHGFELRLIPTLALARTREAMHNSWDKNDPKDAQVILHLLKTGLAQTWHDPMVNGVNDVQELSKTQELADAACRLATGGGFGGRELYSGHDEAVFDATRPLVFNAIPDLGAARPDFLDRAVIVEFLEMKPEVRRDEVHFWREFEEVRPRILG